MFFLSCVPCLVMADASAGSVAVGKESRSVIDAVAVLTDFFGKPTVEISLFDRELTALQRNTVAIGGVELENTLGFSAVGQFLFFFREGSTSCDGNSISYTAIFKKSETFDFQVQTDSFINWAFSSDQLRDYGVSHSQCSLTHGAALKLVVAYEFLLDKQTETQSFKEPLLQQNHEELLFRWDVDINTTLLDQNVVFQESRQGSAELRLSTGQVVDSEAIYIEKNSALAVRFLSDDIAKEQRGTRAGPSGKAYLGGAYLVFDLTGSEPTIKYCSMTISVHLSEGSRRDHSAECHLPDQTLSVSGKLQQGEIIQLILNGTAPVDAGLKRPPMEWHLDLATEIEGQFEK